MQAQVQLANIIELVTREAHVNAKPATQGMRGQLLRPATLLPLLLPSIGGEFHEPVHSHLR